MTIHSLLWLMPHSPFHSSRPSTRSWTATGAPDARWSTWYCAVVGWEFEYCRRFPSSWRHGTGLYRWLNGTRYVGSPDSTQAYEGVNNWIYLFASACNRAVEDAGHFEDRVRSLQSDWRDRVGRTRRDSAVSLLIDALPAAPVLTTSTASELVERSFQATTLAIDRLVKASVLVQVSIGRRNRAFEAPELVDAFTAFERRLASPEGDTRISAPVRRSPAVWMIGVGKGVRTSTNTSQLSPSPLRAHKGR